MSCRAFTELRGQRREEGGNSSEGNEWRRRGIGIDGSPQALFLYLGKEPTFEGHTFRDIL